MKDNNKNYSVLSPEDIEYLNLIYKNDGFENINAPYNEEQFGELFLETLPYDSEPDEEVIFLLPMNL